MMLPSLIRSSLVKQGPYRAPRVPRTAGKSHCSQARAAAGLVSFLTAALADVGCDAAMSGLKQA